MNRVIDGVTDWTEMWRARVFRFPGGGETPLHGLPRQQDILERGRFFGAQPRVAGRGDAQAPRIVC